MTTTAQRAAVVGYARRQIGHPYLWLGTGPSYDCSGLVMMSWRQGGRELPHQSGAQAAELGAIPAGPHSKSRLQLGDVVFYYGSAANPASISHCAVYTGRHDGFWWVVAAVDEAHGVMEHPMNWALPPSAFGYVGHA